MLSSYLQNDSGFPLYNKGTSSLLCPVNSMGTRTGLQYADYNLIDVPQAITVYDSAGKAPSSVQWWCSGGTITDMSGNSAIFTPTSNGYTSTGTIQYYYTGGVITSRKYTAVRGNMSLVDILGGFYSGDLTGSTEGSATAMDDYNEVTKGELWFKIPWGATSVSVDYMEMSGDLFNTVGRTWRPVPSDYTKSGIIRFADWSSTATSWESSNGIHAGLWERRTPFSGSAYSYREMCTTSTGTYAGVVEEYPSVYGSSLTSELYVSNGYDPNMHSFASMTGSIALWTDTPVRFRGINDGTYDLTVALTFKY